MLDEVYARKRYETPLLLECKTYKQYLYYILSLGTHPTAYIVLEKDDKLYGKDYNELGCIDCHYGLTYSESYLTMENIPNRDKSYYVRDKWVIGWDYCHVGDFDGRYPNVNDKKWTVSEIRSECENVINQIIEINQKKISTPH